MISSRLVLLLLALSNCLDYGHVPYSCEVGVKCECEDAGVGARTCVAGEPWGCDCADAGRR